MAYAASLTSTTSTVSRGVYFDALASEPEQLLQKVPTPTESHFQFQIDGAPCYARHCSEDGQSLEIWAVLGYLPYSAESSERRRMLLAILNAAQRLEHVKIGINVEHQIIAMMTCRATEIQSAPFIFLPLARFLQEARPYMRLIGDYL